MRIGVAAALALAVAVAVAAVNVAAQQLQAGTNVNMVGGPASITLDPFKVLGDPNGQRQNEVSMDCGSRNPFTCVAGSNDYRLVDIPGSLDTQVLGDAWLGFYWTKDGGKSWRSTVIPGARQDNSPEGLASPIHGFDASADPTVRAGTNGLFFYSGIAFNRSASILGGNVAAAPGDTNHQQPPNSNRDHDKVHDDDDEHELRTGALFMSLYIDDNNDPRPDVPPRYIRTVVIDAGEQGQFLDKPSHAVDVARADAKSCTIPGVPKKHGKDPKNAIPSQTFPGGNVYSVYSIFRGTNATPRSKIYFAKSEDCGLHWKQPKSLTDGELDTNHIDQSATISIDPRNGDLYVIWRQFRGLATRDALVVTKSTDQGNHWSQPREISDKFFPFDQPTSPDAIPGYRMFRTNSYASACMTDNLLNVVWTERGIGPRDPNNANDPGDSRVMIATSANPTSADPTWVTQPIDNHPQRGHQFMPAISCAMGIRTVAWYDQRDDAAQALGPNAFGPFIADPLAPQIPHSVDVYAAQAPYGAAFSAAVKVSRYKFLLDSSHHAVQVQNNFVNWPLFGNVTRPLIGDYIDVVPERRFLPPTAGNRRWSFNTIASGAPVFHTAWGDNRDVLVFRDAAGFQMSDIDNWLKPGSAGCDAAPTLTTTRNQNIYTSTLTRGLRIEAFGNSRPIGSTPRAFAISLTNSAPVEKFFLLQLIPPSGINVSWAQPPAAAEPTMIVHARARETIARTAFVYRAGPPIVTDPIQVTATEVTIDSGHAVPVPQGLQGFTFLNADKFNPTPADQDVASFAEHHDLTLSDAVTTTFANPYTNPTDLNPTDLNWSLVNPTDLNPTDLNPTDLNTAINLSFINPTDLNPTDLNAAIADQPTITTKEWGITNVGNVPTSYSFNAVIASAVSNKLVFQLFLYRVYRNTSGKGCDLEKVNGELLGNINNLNPTDLNPTDLNPTDLNAALSTFALVPGEEAHAVMVVYHEPGTFNPDTIGAVVTSQASDPGDTTPPVLSCPAPTTESASADTGKAAVPDVLEGVLVSDPGAGSTPLSLVQSPVAGALVGVGTNTIIVTATDASNNTALCTTTFTVVDVTAPTLTLPADISVEATSPGGAQVSYITSAHDVVDGTVPVECNPASGATFPLGATIVTCNAADAAHNASTGTFMVTVVDTTPPALAVPSDITREATSPAGAPVVFTVSATDAANASPALVCTSSPTAGLISGSTFPIGTTTVSCTADDAHGHTTTGSFHVAVQDTTPPALTVPGDITTDATSDAGAIVTFAASASDAATASPAVFCVSSPTPELASGSTFPIGTTTMSCTADDLHSHSVTRSFSVIVRPQPLAITRSQLLDGIVGSQYPPAPQVLERIGGTGPFTWSPVQATVIENGEPSAASLPPGLTLNSETGVISGMPTTEGNYAFRVKVVDSLGAEATQDFCIHIDPTATAAVVTFDIASGAESALSLANNLLDVEEGGVIVTNATFTGSPRALGTFTGGGNPAEGIGFHAGIVLSSGAVEGAKGPNDSTSHGTSFGLGGDAQLAAQAGGGSTTRDAAILEFDFTPACHDSETCNVTFEYVFGSDEYHEYANTQFNDVFAFFMNDRAGGPVKNFAVLPGVSPETPVSINNVNGGNPLGTNAKHLELFRSNRTSTGGGALNVQADGLTVPLQFNAPVISGHTYHIKIAIADVTDGIYDSWVFLKSGSFKVTHVCPIVQQ